MFKIARARDPVYEHYRKRFMIQLGIMPVTYMEGKLKKKIVSDSVKVVLTCSKQHTDADVWGTRFEKCKRIDQAMVEVSCHGRISRCAATDTHCLSDGRVASIRIRASLCMDPNSSRQRDRRHLCATVH